MEGSWRLFQGVGGATGHDKLAAGSQLLLN